MSSIIEQITNRKLVSTLTTKFQLEHERLETTLKDNSRLRVIITEINEDKNTLKDDNLALKKVNSELKTELERLFSRVDELISDIEALKSRLNPEEEKQ